MTGTPVGKEFIDVFNIFRNCDINMWHGWNEYEFIENYYYFKKVSFGAGFKITMPIELKPYLQDTLWNLVRKKAYIVKTNDVLDLKKQKIKLLYIDGLDQTDIYKNLEKKILKYKDYEDTLITLRRTMFKRQAANGFIYDETYDKNPIQFNTNKIDKFEEKISMLIEKLGKIVVTYWFKQDKANITKVLDKLKIKHTTKRSEFRKDAQVFILHFSDSEGLNLQKISRAMLFYSYESSYTMFSQISGRIYRRGQGKKCYYIVFISRGTIEEKMWNNIKNRKEKDDFIKSERG
jgi:SNF2 family DNA or RNA helicase